MNRGREFNPPAAARLPPAATDARSPRTRYGRHGRLPLMRGASVLHYQPLIRSVNTPRDSVGVTI